MRNVVLAVADQERHGDLLHDSVEPHVLIVELSYVLDRIGVTSTATIGAVSAIGSLATAIAAAVYARVARFGPAITVPAAFVLCGLGILGLALADSMPVAAVSAVIAGLGNGLMLPALLT